MKPEVHGETGGQVLTKKGLYTRKPYTSQVVFVYFSGGSWGMDGRPPVPHILDPPLYFIYTVTNSISSPRASVYQAHIERQALSLQGETFFLKVKTSESAHFPIMKIALMGGPPPPFLAHDVGFLTLGSKLDPFLGPSPLFLLGYIRWTPLLKNPGSAPGTYTYRPYSYSHLCWDGCFR